MRTIIFDLDHTLFDAERVLRDGAVDLLAILKRLGVQIVGITNGDHRMLAHLDEAGIRTFFEHVLFASEEQTVEPKSTQAVHHLLSLAGSTLEHTALVSHAHADILLGKDAGIAKVIGVSHGSENARPLNDAGADYVVSHIPAILDVLG